MKKFFSETVYPYYCFLCKKEGQLLCPDCQKTIPFRMIPSCPICQNKKYLFEICPRCKSANHFFLDGIFVTAFWEDPVLKKLIHNFKYDFIVDVKLILDKIIANFVNFHQIGYAPGIPKDIVLCPVPLHQERLLWRGFNQSALLAQKLAALLNVPYEENLLTRKRATVPQAQLDDVNSRKLNVYEAFTTNKNLNIKGKTIIIFDDVTTTGATLNECAKALKKFKPRKIYGFVLAQG